jgi:arsenate reductase
LPADGRNEGSDQVFHQRRHNAAKRGADDNRDRQLDNVAAEHELLEPFEHSRLLWHSAYAELMPKIVVYQKPTCTTCRQVYNALKESGVDFDAVDYYTDPIPKPKLKELLRKMGMKAADLLRTKEPVYKTLKLGERTLSDDDIVDAMVTHPDLIQRPIVEKGSRAILARPAERLKEIL